MYVPSFFFAPCFVSWLCKPALQSHIVTVTITADLPTKNNNTPPMNLIRKYLGADLPEVNGLPASLRKCLLECAVCVAITSAG